jgi:hypothetical protein
VSVKYHTSCLADNWDVEALLTLVTRAFLRASGELSYNLCHASPFLNRNSREGLSISLNYRANLVSSYPTYAHRLHQISLLLGHRPSMPSHLRTVLLSEGPAPTLAYLKEYVSKLTTSPCYLTFCSPTSILILEKDLKAANSRTADDFLAVTNHDWTFESFKPDAWRDMLKQGFPALLHKFLDYSIERKQAVSELWQQSSPGALDVTQVKDWLGRVPVQNESTHFSCIMDPAVEGGGLLWVRGFREPYEMG